MCHLGRWDVDDWLDEISPQQLDRLIEDYEAGAFDFEGWHQTAWLAYMMHIELVQLRCQLGNTKPTEKHFRSPQDFMPPNLKHWFGPGKKKGDSIEAFRRQAEAKYGQ